MYSYRLPRPLSLLFFLGYFSEKTNVYGVFSVMLTSLLQLISLCFGRSFPVFLPYSITYLFVSFILFTWSITRCVLASR